MLSPLQASIILYLTPAFCNSFMGHLYLTNNLLLPCNFCNTISKSTFSFLFRWRCIYSRFFQECSEDVCTVSDFFFLEFLEKNLTPFDHKSLPPFSDKTTKLNRYFDGTLTKGDIRPGFGGNLTRRPIPPKIRTSAAPLTPAVTQPKP